jgi:hypothetical protein
LMHLMVKNRLARELLINYPLDNLLVTQLSHPRPLVFHIIYSGLTRWPKN